jgi:hypothetical protein
LEAKDNLQRMLVSVPLTDDERAAVEDGQGALEKLLEHLADVPTPAGLTPQQNRYPGRHDAPAGRRGESEANVIGLRPRR